MTRDEFEQGYCERSNISLKEYRRWYVTLPCACDYEGCQGWAAVRNDPYIIEHHKEFNTPEVDVK